MDLWTPIGSTPGPICRICHRRHSRLCRVELLRAMFEHSWFLCLLLLAQAHVVGAICPKEARKEQLSTHGGCGVPNNDPRPCPSTTQWYENILSPNWARGNVTVCHSSRQRDNAHHSVTQWAMQCQDLSSPYEPLSISHHYFHRSISSAHPPHAIRAGAVWQTPTEWRGVLKDFEDIHLMTGR